MYHKMSGDTFAASLSTAFLRGKLSAKACEMVWYAHNEGAQSRGTELMYKPGASIGFYAQHSERALGLDYDTETLYSVRAHNSPGQVRSEPHCHGSPRPSLQLMKLGIKKFENLPELACAINSWLVLLSGRQRAARTLSSLESGGLASPLAMYLDAFSCIHLHAILGMTMLYLLTMRRHLLAVLVRSKMCRCGCRGWCILSDVEFPSVAQSRLKCTRFHETGLRGLTAVSPKFYRADWREAWPSPLTAWVSARGARVTTLVTHVSVLPKMNGPGDVEAVSFLYLLKSVRHCQAACGTCKRRVMYDLSLNSPWQSSTTHTVDGR